MEARIDQCEAAIRTFAVIAEELRALGAPAEGKSRRLNHETMVTLTHSLRYYRAALATAKMQRSTVEG